MPLTIEYRPIVLPPELRAPARAPGQGAPRSPAPKGFLARRKAWASLATAGAVALAIIALNGLPPEQAHATASPLQPLETPGMNFPGSAFYYLEPGSGVVTAAPGPLPELPAAGAHPLDAAFGDAIARPTFLAGTGEDRSRALHCLTTAIYYEAATEPDAGQRAVAQVVLNRVAHPHWPNSVCGVVFEGSERPGCQFSFACDGSMARAPARSWWLRARAVAERALSGEVYAPVGLATYYHTGAVDPPWAARQVFVGAIGAHLFYRPPGPAGTRTAFTDRYFGGEPSPFPHPRIEAPALPDPGPSAAPLREAAPSAMVPAALPPLAAPAAAAAPSSGLLPQSGRIREEYRNSGRWIARPGG